MNVIEVKNDPFLFTKKQDIIIKLNKFMYLLASTYNIKSKLEINRINNSNGSTFNLHTFETNPSDYQKPWFKTYKNLILPTINALIFDSIFPTEAINKELDTEWKRLVKINEDSGNTPMNSDIQSGNNYSW